MLNKFFPIATRLVSCEMCQVMECTGRCVALARPNSVNIVGTKYRKFGDSPEIRRLARDVIRWECRPYPTIQPPPLAYFFKIEVTAATSLPLFRQRLLFSIIYHSVCKRTPDVERLSRSENALPTTFLTRHMFVAVTLFGGENGDAVCLLLLLLLLLFFITSKDSRKVEKRQKIQAITYSSANT